VYAFIPDHAVEDPDVSDVFEREALAAWDALFNGRAGEYADASQVQADFEELQAAAEQAKVWADRHIAHTGRERADRAPTVGELDTAIDTIGEIFKRYNQLLHGSSYLTLEPPGMRVDLTELFGRAWVRESG
jgi:hypothetical protein